jgi:hypothetical protein
LKELTIESFDAIAEGRPAPKPVRPVWSLPAIGGLLGIGVDGVRALLAEPGCPIQQKGGRYYVYADDLERWMRGNKAA